MVERRASSIPRSAGGLLKAAHRGARLCARCDAERIERKTGGFTVLTNKGPVEAVRW